MELIALLQITTVPYPVLQPHGYIKSLKAELLSRSDEGVWVCSVHHFLNETKTEMG